MDNSSLSAEYGQNSGAVVNIATRSGSNQFHGELFEYLRNDALDARNFFDFTSSEARPFKRNQFGGSLGGPVVKNRTFFFVSYEGLRQRQELQLNSLVLSDAERASAVDPVIRKLIELIPQRANLRQRLRFSFITELGRLRPDNLPYDLPGNSQLAANRLNRLALDKKRAADLRNRLHNQHPNLGFQESWKPLWTLYSGVPIGCRSPRKGGPYSTPKLNPHAERPR